VVRNKTVPRISHARDKALMHPTPHCVRRGWVSAGNHFAPALAQVPKINEGAYRLPRLSEIAQQSQLDFLQTSQKRLCLTAGRVARRWSG
jgi:hypothetical protein